MAPVLGRYVRNLVVFAALAAANLIAGPGKVETTLDPFMGDWQGSLKGPGGADSAVAAQVIALGKGEYQVNVLGAFDTREPALAVATGRFANGKVEVENIGTITETTFTGRLRGKRAGLFTMTKAVRLSPTLGARPPAGAVVLWDGTSLDQWLMNARPAGLIDLSRLLKGTERVGYLKNRIYSKEQQPARLEIGSDDGVKVWLNGDVVHANNTPRGCVPNEDKVDIVLQKGWNDLLLKVVQGGGGWAAVARIVARDGSFLDGLQTKYSLPPYNGKPMDALDAHNEGYIIVWQAAGPYTKQGKKGIELFDEAFPPETSSETATWKLVNKDAPPEGYRWKLVDGGAMEVGLKAGSIVSKETFGSFKMHLEFRTPFMPTARGQGRGNSGVYIQARYEVQVLDSYGLEGKDNECGGVYKTGRPRVNMCAPPGQWQTYDITFHAPAFGADGKKTEDARLTVLHNGVMIHDNLPIPKPTGGGRRDDPSTPGPILLQDHGNPVQYRNIWVEKL